MATYLIVGASSGIGAACARALDRPENTLVLVARSLEKLEQMKREFLATVWPVEYDLEDVDHIRTIFDFCKNQNLKLDGMVYSAGMNADVPFKACTAELFERVMRVNCIAFAEIGKWFYSKRYSNDSSRIVAISSSASLGCDKGMGPYSASKAALNAVVKTMAKEFVRRGILVNALLPAGVLTPMAVKKIEILSGETIDLDAAIHTLETQPVKIDENAPQPYGIIPPGYIAQLVSYLVSSENRYVTGALLPVSAGLNF